MNFLSAISNIFTPVFTLGGEISDILTYVFTYGGVISFVFDIFSFRSWVVEKYSNWREKHKSIKILNSSDYFIAHVIQIGGVNSRTYTLTVFVSREGGYYLNPPKKFVSIGFNRGGDVLNLMPSKLSKKQGFEVQGVAEEYGEYKDVPNKDIASLPIQEMKNEYWVKFTRSNSKK